MERKNSTESALSNLIRLSSEKGFLIFDDIYHEADKWDLSIRDVDYLSSSIVTRGILIYDEAPVTDAKGSDDEDYDDYAQSDYDLIFNRVIELDPDLKKFITFVRNIIPPQAREMDQLKYQVREGNIYARERVIQMHLRLAVKIALQRAEAYDSEIADTLQEACVGLIMAVDRYNPDSNGNFGPYASLWMLQNMGRSQGTQRPEIYYPVHKKEMYLTMYPILREEGCLDCDAIWTCKEVREYIKKKVQCSSENADDVINQSIPLESLNFLQEPYDSIEDNESQYYEIKEMYYHAASYNETGYEKIEENSLRLLLIKILNKKLKPREQEVIRARYGFDDGREKTLEEVGQQMGVTRERIRQIEARAIKKLREPSVLKMLMD